MKTTLTTLLLAIATLSSCTENKRAREFGGTMTVNLPPNTKLVNATWKDTSVWYLYRQKRQGETSETYTFQESSGWGIMNGKVLFVEK